MAEKIRSEAYINSLTNVGCIPQAIKIDGRTMDEILKDIEKEKQLEKQVLSLTKRKYSNVQISRILKIKKSKVAHIMKFDSLGLSYLKVGKNNEQ